MMRETETKSLVKAIAHWGEKNLLFIALEKQIMKWDPTNSSKPTILF